MLRLLALVLVLANALLLAAQLGVFEPITGASSVLAQREPDRLQRQVHPEWVRILPSDAASAALQSAAASAAGIAQPGACLEAGPFGGPDAEAAERTLRDAGIAEGAWQVIRTEDPGAFMIYMGRYPDREALQRKLEQIKRLRLPAEDLRDHPELQHGLSLGRFDSRPEADATLARMAQSGLRTARVITLRPAQSKTVLRVPVADVDLRARLAGLQMPGGPGFVDCAAESATAAASAADSPASSASSASSGSSASSAAAAAPVASAASAPAAAQASAPR